MRLFRYCFEPPALAPVAVRAGLILLACAGTMLDHSPGDGMRLGSDISSSLTRYIGPRA